MPADAGRKELAGVVWGRELERALSAAARDAVRRTADEVSLGDQRKARDVALVIREVFGGQVPAGSLADGETTLEVLRAGKAQRHAHGPDDGRQPRPPRPPLLRNVVPCRA